jgi:hypothetical protein
MKCFKNFDQNSVGQPQHQTTQLQDLIQLFVIKLRLGVKKSILGQKKSIWGQTNVDIEARAGNSGSKKILMLCNSPLSNKFLSLTI